MTEAAPCEPIEFGETPTALYRLYDEGGKLPGGGSVF